MITRRTCRLFVFARRVIRRCVRRLVLIREDHRNQQCRSAGFDGYRQGSCVYKSRYINLQYTTTTPELAAEWIIQVKEGGGCET